MSERSERVQEQREAWIRAARATVAAQSELMLISVKLWQAVADAFSPMRAFGQGRPGARSTASSPAAAASKAAGTAEESVDERLAEAAAQAAAKAPVSVDDRLAKAAKRRPAASSPKPRPKRSVVTTTRKKG